MKLNQMIFRALTLILALNTRVYGSGATREVCRDLAGMNRAEAN